MVMVMWAICYCAYDEDIEFIIKVILVFQSIMFIPDLLAFYVLRESSTTQTVTRTITIRFENLHVVYECIYSFIHSSTNDKNLLKLWKGRIGTLNTFKNRYSIVWSY